MANALTRFEVELPFVDGGSAQDTAIQNFKTSMLTLCPLYFSNFYKEVANGTITQSNFCSGFITSAQQATALGYLNTLNNALVAAGSATVWCTAWNVTSEP